MTFAREETRARLRNASWLRRQINAVLVATSGYVIVASMFNKKVYEKAGLDVQRANREAKANENHHAKLRASCTGLMDFLSSTGLLTGPAKAIYRLGHLI